MAPTQLTKEIQNKFNLNHIYARNVVYSLSNMKNIKKFGLYLLVLGLVLVGGFSSISKVYAANTATNINVTPSTYQYTTFKGVPVYRLHINNSGAPDTLVSLSPTPVGNVVDPLITLHFYKDANDNGIVDQGDTDLNGVIIATGFNHFTSDDTKAVFTLASPLAIPFGVTSILITADGGPAVGNAQTLIISFALSTDIVMGTVQITPAPGVDMPNTGVLTVSDTAPSLAITNGLNNPGPTTATPNQTGIVVKQLTITAAATSDSIVSIAMTPGGSEDATNVAATKFYIDLGTLGVIDPGVDILLSTTPTTYSSNGIQIFTFLSPILIPGGTPGPPVNILYTYDLGAGVTGGKTLTAQLFGTAGAVAGSGVVVSSNASTVSSTITISNSNITFTAGTDTRDYDGGVTSTGTPTVTSGSLALGDHLVFSTQTFSDKNASVGDKILNITPGSISIWDIGNADVTANYTISLSPFTTGTINKATPTATISVNNTPQDYTGAGQAATVNLDTNSVPGAVANILTGGTATKTNAGTYAVTADFVPTDTTNYNTLTALSAGNFIINKITPTASITNSPVNYNGGAQTATVACLGGGTATLATGGTGTNAGSYPATVNCDASTNYAAASGLVAGNFVINPITPTASITNSPVTYNGGAQTATVACLGGGTATLATGGTGTNAGSYPATVNCDASTNYAAASGLVAGNFVINKVDTTGSFTVAPSKTYDGGVTVSTLTQVVDDKIRLDDVSLTGGVATYADPNANIGITVSLVGATLTGGAAGNYNLTTVTDTTADITKIQLTHTTPTIILSKTYDGDTAAAITAAGTLSGVIGDEDVTTTEVATYDNKDVGTGKTITVAYTLAGADQGNYLKPVDDTTTVIGVIARRSLSGGGGYFRPVPIVIPTIIMPITLNLAESVKIITSNGSYNDIAIAIVPKLPKTGFPPEEKSTMFPIIAFAGVSAISIFLYFARKFLRGLRTKVVELA